MKISFDEILPSDSLLYAGTQNSSNFSILGPIGGRFGSKCTFSTFDLENDCHADMLIAYTFKLVTRYSLFIYFQSHAENIELSHVKIGHMV
jgi:hypothetical protein